MVTGLPFYATKHGCRQALRDREGEPELFGVTRRQTLGRHRLDGRRCRIDRIGDSRRFGRSHGFGCGLYGQCRRGRRFDHGLASLGCLGIRRGATNRINNPGSDDGTDGDEDQPGGFAAHSRKATLSRAASLRNRGASGLPPEQPRDAGTEELARRALAVIERRRHEVLRRQSPVKTGSASGDRSRRLEAPV